MPSPSDANSTMSQTQSTFSSSSPVR